MNVQSIAYRLLNHRSAAAALLALIGGVAQASNLDFALLNSTNQPIVALWATPTGNPGWGTRFDNTFVPESGSQQVHFVDDANGACYYDLRVQFSEGAVRYWRDVNLCSINRFRVYVQGGEVKGLTY